MKDHPECRHSMSSQKECSSTNGKFACETIRRVFRNCPGLRPEQVYDITTRDAGTVPKPPGGGGGGSDGGIPVLGGRASQQPVSHGSQRRLVEDLLHTLTRTCYKAYILCIMFLDMSGRYCLCWCFLSRPTPPRSRLFDSSRSRVRECLCFSRKPLPPLPRFSSPSSCVF